MKIPFLQISKQINDNFSIDKGGTGMPNTIPSLPEVGRQLRNPPSRSGIVSPVSSNKSKAIIGAPSASSSALIIGTNQNKVNSIFGAVGTYDKVTISAQGKTLSSAQDGSLASKLRKQVEDQINQDPNAAASLGKKQTAKLYKTLSDVSKEASTANTQGNAVDTASTPGNAVDATRAQGNGVDAAKAQDNVVDTAKAQDNGVDTAKAQGSGAYAANSGSNDAVNKTQDTAIDEAVVGLKTTINVVA